MRLSLVTPLVAGLLLAGCSKEAEKPKTEEQVRAAASQLVKPQPGQYRSTFKVVSFEVPGMPAEQEARMRDSFTGTMRGQEYCLTPEQAAGGFEEALKKLPQGMCSYDHFTVTGNALDALLTCRTGENQKGTVALKGTVGTTGSQMTMTIEGNKPSPEVSGMKMVAEVSSERLGDCAPPAAAQ